MNRAIFIFLMLLSLLAMSACGGNQAKQAHVREANYAKEPRFKLLVYFNDNVEIAHQQFAHQGIDFYKGLTVGEGFIVDTTSNLATYSFEELMAYNTIIAMNVTPGEGERDLFEKYIENGGGWVGYHAAAYNDVRTKWPWLNQFLGCGVFKCNNWPPQPALLELDVQDHPVTKNIPKEFVAPASEWYQWATDVRNQPDIEVLVSLSAKNYPIGLKDIVYGNDFPVVWTNKKYRMIYLNMGHGDVGYTDATQNLLYINALRWIISRDPKGNPFDK